MTLSQQFALISLLPATLLLLALYVLWRNARQRHAALFLAFALVTAAVWASGALTFYGGRTMPVELRFSWRVVSNHALSLVPLWLWLATVAYLGLARSYRQFVLGTALLLWLISFALDPAIWSSDLPSFLLFGQTIRHFDLWAAVWITAALLPLTLAWWTTYRATHQMPASHYRDQTDYWLLALSCFLLAAGLGFPRELLYQQVAILLAIAGGVSGTAVLVRDYLPNVEIMLRHLARTLVAAVTMFALSWLAFSFAGDQLATWPAELRNSGVAALAGLFVLIFLLISSINSRHARRLIFQLTSRSGWSNDGTASAAGIMAPDEVGHLAARLIQSRFACDDVWLLTATTGVGGGLLLRAALAPTMAPPAVALPADALLTRYFRQNRAPLLQYDLDYSNNFKTLTEAERSLLAQWRRTLFAPLHVGQRLVGILALGEKKEPGLFDQADVTYLEELARSLALLLAQAEQVSLLAQTVDHLAEQNRFLAYEKQRLQEVTRLYHDFLSLISPELRRPFGAIERDIERTEALVNSGRPPAFDPLRQQVNCLKEVVTNLVNMADRVQQQQAFSFQPLLFDEIVREVQQGLDNMAGARRVKVDLHLERSNGALVYGDRRRLAEAVQHLLHNAIKFNKIGGLVRVESGVNGRELFMHVLDNGVGIPPERLPGIWSGFSNLESINVYNPKGAGMGLLLTRFIVQAHGGRVEASSNYGRGSIFSFYLPTIIDSN
jgi:two-component system, OmpR family, sensor histidine kinase SenX3